jgi:hypothetical protein
VIEDPVRKFFINTTLSLDEVKSKIEALERRNFTLHLLLAKVTKRGDEVITAIPWTKIEEKRINTTIISHNRNIICWLETEVNIPPNLAQHPEISKPDVTLFEKSRAQVDDEKKNVLLDIETYANRFEEEIISRNALCGEQASMRTYFEMLYQEVQVSGPWHEKYIEFYEKYYTECLVNAVIDADDIARQHSLIEINIIVSGPLDFLTVEGNVNWADGRPYKELLNISHQHNSLPTRQQAKWSMYPNSTGNYRITGIDVKKKGGDNVFTVSLDTLGITNEARIQVPTYPLTIIVNNARGRAKNRPLPDVEITIDGEPAGTTDKLGTFSLELPAGAYTISYVKSGFKDYMDTVSIVADNNISTVNDSTLMVTLEPTRAKKTRAQVE